MGKKFSPTMVGLFVVGAVILAVVGVAVFGSGQFFRQTDRFIIFFEGSVNGLRIGAPVKVKGVQIGEVVDIRLGIADVQLIGMDPPRIPVVIELDLGLLRSRGASGDPPAANRERLIKEGLRAQLNMESFVTGLLYVSFDFFPDAPVELVGGDNLPYPELPAIPTTLEQATSAAAEIINKLKEMKFEEMVADLRQAANGINQLANSEGLQAGVDSLGEVMDNTNKAIKDVRTTIAKIDKLGTDLDATVGTVQKELVSTTAEARRALTQATASLKNVGTLTQPDAPLAQQLTATLSDVSQAARRLNNFLDYLERNPSALIRGKSVAEDK
jgi:paraquat-inducible protein B